MKLLLPPLIAVGSLAAAADSASIDAAKIRQSFYPKIETKKLSSGWSLYGCPTEELEITGKDPVDLKKRSVKLSLYKARGKGRGRVVIILPPTGGVNILDQGYANSLCSNGISAAIISEWDHQDNVSLSFEMHNDGALRAVAATRHAVEYLTNDHSSIGILGTSIGAVASSLVLSFEPRISSAAFIAGSARFADVVTYSDEAGASELRVNRMKKFGYKNIDEYRRAVQDSVWVDPIRFADQIGPIKSLVVSADADTTVPTEHQFELVELLKAEKHIRLKGNHLQVIKQTFCDYSREIVDFFNGN